MTAFGAIRSLWRTSAALSTPTERPQELIACLDSAAELGQRLAEQVAASADHEPRANAAAICRWEILVLRDRVEGLRLPPTYERTRAQVVRRLEDAAVAARQLSSGYRFPSLDRICEGGQALDDHLEALSQIRERLAAS